MIERIDKSKYGDKDLIEVKIPLQLPYNYSWANYERVDGEIQYNGNYYTYVKRKVANDTLFILCLPNVTKKEIQTAEENYSKKVNDIPSEKNNNSSVKKYTLMQYFQTVREYTFYSFADLKRQQTFSFSSRLTSTFLENCFKPPEVTA